MPDNSEPITIDLMSNSTINENSVRNSQGKFRKMKRNNSVGKKKKKQTSSAKVRTRQAKGIVYDYVPGKMRPSPSFGSTRNSSSNLNKKHSKTIIESQIAKQQVLVLNPYAHRIQRMTQPSQSQNKGRQQSYQVINSDNEEEDDASWI